MKLSVIIPCYNDGSRIEKTLFDVSNYLTKQDFDFEVIIVDDGSTDDSKEKIEKMINKWPQFQVIGYKENKGKGAAIAFGVKHCKGNKILFMDADQSTPISQFEQFKQFLTAYPVIIGSRYLRRGYIKIKQPFWRIFFARSANLLIRLMLGLKLTDTQCGFKMFETSIAKKIFAKMTLNRWGFDFEILLIAKKMGLEIKEVPVFWYNERRSKVRPKDFLRTLGELWQVRKNLKKGKYD